MRVLHIEDRRENRLLVRKLLEARGFEVVDAVDGLVGLELARTVGPDLILVDINIPGLDGYEVVTRLKGDPALAETPVVAITAEGDRGRALALGFDGFIMKPIKMGQFVGQLRDFLQGKKEAIPEEERADHLVEHNRRVVDRLEAKVRELTRANDKLREVDRLKMEVLRNVSHELATPMTPLMGYVKMLSGGELGAVSEGQRGVLERMNGSLARLKGLIDNLLNTTRFATGAVSLQRRVVDLRETVDAVLSQVQGPAGRRRVRLDFQRPESLEPAVADQARLTEALRHVVENAIKFGPEGGCVRIETRVLVEGEGDRRFVEIAVSDEGPGIPPGEREQVVQPFYQADGSATRHFGGAGLGLAIAERTASLHAGRLVITEAAGGGARIALHIPTR